MNNIISKLAEENKKLKEELNLIKLECERLAYHSTAIGYLANGIAFQVSQDNIEGLNEAVCFLDEASGNIANSLMKMVNQKSDKIVSTYN